MSLRSAPSATSFLATLRRSHTVQTKETSRSQHCSMAPANSLAQLDRPAPARLLLSAHSGRATLTFRAMIPLPLLSSSDSMSTAAVTLTPTLASIATLPRPHLRPRLEFAHTFLPLLSLGLASR